MTTQDLMTMRASHPEGLVAQVHTRRQKSVGAGGPGKFGGPDTYVAVTVAPRGVDVPHALRADVLAKRGIKLEYFGEGYAEHQGPRSALGRALEAARAFAKSINDDPAATSPQEYQSSFLDAMERECLRDKRDIREAADYRLRY